MLHPEARKNAHREPARQIETNGSGKALSEDSTHVLRMRSNRDEDKNPK
jgi:hypothetical protein